MLAILEGLLLITESFSLCCRSVKHTPTAKSFLMYRKYTVHFAHVVHAVIPKSVYQQAKEEKKGFSIFQTIPAAGSCSSLWQDECDYFKIF